MKAKEKLDMLRHEKDELSALASSSDNPAPASPEKKVEQKESAAAKADSAQPIAKPAEYKPVPPPQVNMAATKPQPLANAVKTKPVPAGNEKLKNQKKAKDDRPKKEKIKKTFYEQKRHFSEFIAKAGIESSFETINKTIIILSAALSGLVCIYLVVMFIIEKTLIFDALTLLLIIGASSAATAYMVSWLLFFVYVDLQNFNRKKEIEAVFPDFLQLTAANISAGMPIDRALWFAIRPRFGILAKDMESVAKATMVGENLATALIEFSNKYDSITLRRSINLIVEGMESGGEVGDLLMRISNNIRETEIMKKEMSSSVTTYVVFILFATLVAAPFLFGLTTELIVIMKKVLGTVSMSAGAGIGGLSMSPDRISVDTYRTFAMITIAVSTTMATIIVSVIQKGNAREAITKIPIYVLLGMGIYYVAFMLLNGLLGSLF